jgi:lipoate-protein ligase A
VRTHRSRHGEYKTPGGKLVAVDFDIFHGRFANVMVTGDFFLYPEEALEPIRLALEGLPVMATRAEISDAIARAIAPGVELIGFSPEAIAIAVERGLRNDD